MIEIKNRISMLTNEYPPRLGGAGAFADRLVKCTQCSCIQPSFANSLFYFGKKRLAKCVWLPELIFQIIKNKNSLKESNLIINDFGGALAYKIATLFGAAKIAKPIYIHHGLITAGNGKMQKTKATLLKYFTREWSNIAVSYFLKEELRKKEFIIDNVIHIGAPDIHAKPSSCIAAFNIDQEVISIVSLTRINENKLPLQTLDYLSKLAYELNKIIVYHVYGSGTEKYINEVLKKAAFFENIKVEFKKQVSSQNIFEVMNSYQIVLNPSTLPEACPTISLEAAIARKIYLYNGYNGNNELSLYHKEMCVQIHLHDGKSPCHIAKMLKLYSQRQYECVNREVPTISDYLNDLEKFILDRGIGLFH